MLPQAVFRANIDNKVNEEQLREFASYLHLFKSRFCEKNRPTQEKWADSSSLLRISQTGEILPYILSDIQILLIPS